MKRSRQTCAALLLTLAFALPAAAGEITTMVVQGPPPPSSSAAVDGAAPEGSYAADALNLLRSMLALF